MPIIFKNTGAPTCCGMLITRNGYCILCMKQYEIIELQEEIVRRIRKFEATFDLVTEPPAQQAHSPTLQQ